MIGQRRRDVALRPSTDAAKPGFAGIDNDRYLDPKTAMLFGDAKHAVGKVV